MWWTSGPATTPSTWCDPVPSFAQVGVPARSERWSARSADTSSLAIVIRFHAVSGVWEGVAAPLYRASSQAPHSSCNPLS